MHNNTKHFGSYNFDLLCKYHPKLMSFIISKHGKKTIDFSDSKAVKNLNKALLFTYYDIKYWDFPDTNLCPPIPGRADYIHYLTDLFDEDIYNLKVLDIGTGASVIYPLLGVSCYNWSFVASDIDKLSLNYAKINIDKNNLKDKIELRLQPNENNILKGVINSNESFAITMCNPPFYKNLQEASKANFRKTKNLDIKSERNFSGKLNELCYKGGEKAFLHTYLYESSQLAKSSKWFTSLVSKKENVKSLEESAKKLNASVFKIIPMHQGNKITRIVCWSFM